MAVRICGFGRSGEVHDELRDWSLHRVLWVGDRGFTSVENRAHLQRAGGHVLFGEKLRGVADSAQALARPGRYRVVADNLHVKEVWVGDGATRRRFIVCRTSPKPTATPPPATGTCSGWRSSSPRSAAAPGTPG